MHLAVGLLALIAVWHSGVWRKWETYHHTMMYFALGNLLYNFLTANYFLWKFKPDFFPNHSMTEMIYTFITFPATALLFLANYPDDYRKKFVYYLKWIAIYITVEFLFSASGRIVYQHGWNVYWSFIFDLTLFPMLRFHYRKPLYAYGISVIFCVLWVWLFNVPVDVPVEKRGG